MTASDRVLLGHGSGGLMTHRLVQEVFLRHLGNSTLAQLGDAALLSLESGQIALTTDSFVVDPLFFPGGDIGKLAVCGTVNDLVVSGARPRALAAGFILEEGLPLTDLERIVASMAAAAREARVEVVTGDTKVVPRGKGDGCFITTTGVGVLVPGVRLGVERARPGDRIIVTGPVGDHGAAIMISRAGIDLRASIVSDCAPLGGLLLPLLSQPEGLHAMRDPTRGGLATVLCEIAEAAQVSILIEETRVPVNESVRTVSELLGLDPFYLACEGRAVLVVAQDATANVLGMLRAHGEGSMAAMIGEVQAGPARVVSLTPTGGHRLIPMLSADPLPRIC